jgi:hypothetical protein
VGRSDQLALGAAGANICAMSSLRMPQSLSARLRIETGEGVLQYELMEEQAHALGRAGRKVETALAALRDHDAAGGDAEARGPLLKAASDAVWGFLVQREVMGLRDRAAVVAQYAIPREVLNRIGAR